MTVPRWTGGNTRFESLRDRRGDLRARETSLPGDRDILRRQGLQRDRIRSRSCCPFNDECAAALLRGYQSRAIEQAIGACHGIEIDSQLDRQLTNGGQLASGRQPATVDMPLNLAIDLQIGWQSSVEVQPERERAAFPGGHIVLIVSYVPTRIKGSTRSRRDHDLRRTRAPG